MSSRTIYHIISCRLNDFVALFDLEVPSFWAIERFVFTCSRILHEWLVYKCFASYLTDLKLLFFVASLSHSRVLCVLSTEICLIQHFRNEASFWAERFYVNKPNIILVQVWLLTNQYMVLIVVSCILAVWCCRFLVCLGVIIPLHIPALHHHHHHHQTHTHTHNSTRIHTTFPSFLPLIWTIWIRTLYEQVNLL